MTDLPSVHHMCTFWMAETKFSKHKRPEKDEVEYLHLKDTEKCKFPLQGLLFKVRIQMFFYQVGFF